MVTPVSPYYAVFIWENCVYRWKTQKNTYLFTTWQELTVTRVCDVRNSLPSLRKTILLFALESEYIGLTGPHLF